MIRSHNPVREAMASLAREELRGAEHLSTSRLIAYHRGEIPPAETPAITEHLSLCTECSALALEVAEFFADDDDEEDATPSAREAAWQELQTVMSGPDRRPPAPAFLSPVAAPPRRSPIRSLALAYGLAATFAAVSVGLVFFREKAPSPSLQPDPGLYDLTSSGSMRTGETNAKLIRFQAPDESAILILNPEGPLTSNRSRVRISDSAGAIVWESDLTLQPTGGFHLSLPAGALASGRYSLDLNGLIEGRETSLGQYQIAIEE